MTVTKEAVRDAAALGGENPQVAAELEAASLFSKIPLKEEEVYLFSVRLCDNQVDRDEEAFPLASLEQLAPLFVGKTGIFDHAWSAKNQTARIYRTEVVSEPGVVEETGEAAAFLKGYAYMLRTEANADLIAEIQAGIKKEVSVSCAVSRCLCSICGGDMSDPQACGHGKGRVYEGKRCVALLTDPQDAFEWSFVAVPAQRNAGVMKALRVLEGHPDLGGLLQEMKAGDQFAEKLKRLEKEAALGRRYLEELRGEVVRLGLLAQTGLEREMLLSITAGMAAEDLVRLRGVYEKGAGARYPLKPQLSYEEEKHRQVPEDQVFRI